MHWQARFHRYPSGQKVLPKYNMVYLQGFHVLNKDPPAHHHNPVHFRSRTYEAGHLLQNQDFLRYQAHHRKSPLRTSRHQKDYILYGNFLWQPSGIIHVPQRYRIMPSLMQPAEIRKRMRQNSPCNHAAFCEITLPFHLLYSQWMFIFHNFTDFSVFHANDFVCTFCNICIMGY